MFSKDFDHGFGEEKTMPSDAQERTPGVYTRAENELPHELDMLWSNSKAYQREDRSPLISFIAGFLVGAILTGAVFMLFFSQPKVKSEGEELTAPITEDINAGNGKASKSSAPAAELGATKSGSYTVSSGDTLGRIAGKVYGSSAPEYVQKLQQANNMPTPDSLQIGQKLVVPPKDY